MPQLHNHGQTEKSLVCALFTVFAEPTSFYWLTIIASSPGHDADDDLMYGTGKKDSTPEKPERTAHKDSQVGSPDVAVGGTAQSADTSQASTTSGPQPSTRSHAQHDTENPITQPATERYSTGARDGTELAQSRDEKPPAAGQTSIYSSYPLATGDSTSRVVSRESEDPTTYQQAETMNIPGSFGPDTRSGADYAPAAPASQTFEPNENNSPPQQDSSHTGGMPMGGGRQLGAQDNKSDQIPEKTYQSPYASSPLDPRVDPHAKSPDSSHPSATGGAAAKHSSKPTEGYGSSTENMGLTADPMASSNQTSQPSYAPQRTAEPFAGAKGTSHP